MDILDRLYDLLRDVNVTDRMMERGVKLTRAGYRKVANILDVREEDVPVLIDQLRGRNLVTETPDRYAYEADYVGNVTVRDTVAGTEHHLMGDSAIRLINDLKRNPARKDELIAPFFTVLNEDGGEDIIPVQTQNPNTDIDPIQDVKGTFNFPNRGRFVVAQFGITKSNKFATRVISVMDGQNNEIDITDSERKSLDDLAWKWKDRV